MYYIKYMYWYLVYDIIDHKLVMNKYESNYSSLITIDFKYLYILQTIDVLYDI